jgi:hypothetical protein
MMGVGGIAGANANSIGPRDRPFEFPNRVIFDTALRAGSE